MLAVNLLVGRPTCLPILTSTYIPHNVVSDWLCIFSGYDS